MNTNKRLSIISGLLVVIGLIFGQEVIAQQKQHQGPPPIPNQEQIDKMVDEMAKTLSLDKEQKKEVKKKFAKHFEEVKAKIEASRPKREEMEALKSDFEKDVKSVLNDEQKKQFDAFMKEKEKERNKRKPRK